MGSVPCKHKFASRFVEHECALTLCCESKCDERRNSGSRTQWLLRALSIILVSLTPPLQLGIWIIEI